ncbi:MAG: alpha/beta fold hydrolase [archaeon]
MRKMILVHGWSGSPTSEPWFNWLKDESEKRGIEFIAPVMPNTNNPKMSEWVDKLRETIENLDEETYLVGHSMGCLTIIKYLSELINQRVAGIVFVAPWIELDKKSIEEEGEESVRIVKSWINEPINFENTKNSTEKILSIFSDNDPYVLLSNVKTFEKKLNSEIIIKNNEGHFNETCKINEILELVEDDNTNNK